MGRNYSDRLLRALSSVEEDDNLGIQLGKLCAEAQLPITHVAKALGVTRLSAYHWFQGRQIRTKKQPLVRAFMMVVEQDLQKGMLPMPNAPAAKAYLEGIAQDA
jgi:hypothetical protein